MSGSTDRHRRAFGSAGLLLIAPCEGFQRFLLTLIASDRECFLNCRTHVRHDRRASGFTYVGVLVAVAILGLGLATAAPVWQTIGERHRLVELDWIGNEFVRAFASYYEGTPGIVIKTYPSSLQNLVRDDRFIVVRRHLRRVYANPFSGQPDWELIAAPQGGIRGVRVAIYVGGKLETRAYTFNAPFQR